MAKEILLLSVFVASPDDVAEERAALEDVVKELNSLWRESKGIRLELIKWETHAYPSVGKDVQSVINEQIGDKYDIFIGILWKKFGTQTGRASSGTEEEFNIAYDRYKNDPKSIRIMFYFKGGSVNLYEIDPVQFLKVKQFKESLGKKGSLYWEYTSIEEFSRFLRMHLSNHVEDFGKKWGTSMELAENKRISINTNNQITSPEKIESEEEGFLDLIEIGIESFQNIPEILQQITASTKSLGKRLKSHTEEIYKALKLSGVNDIRAMKHIYNHAAEDLDQYARVLEVQVPILGERFSKGIDAYSKVASILPDFSLYGEDIEEPLTESMETVSYLEDVIMNSLKGIVKLRENIEESPRATTQYNRAKRKAVNALDGFINEVQSCIQQLDETHKVMQNIKNNIKHERT